MSKSPENSLIQSFIRSMPYGTPKKNKKTKKKFTLKEHKKRESKNYSPS
jgi:hypothetical protein